jgi:hypothetical protein
LANVEARDVFVETSWPSRRKTHTGRAMYEREVEVPDRALDADDGGDPE